jgi:DNA-directed RNA polymerase specialized sigma24 family protein
VLAARGDSAESTTALDQLCRTYWYPLYAYVRRFGHGVHDAQDLTQAFFAELFDKSYLRAADRERGKFRSFLLTAFRHFLAHEWEKKRAAKRGGGVPPLYLDEQTAEEWYQQEPATAGAPDQLYDRTWGLRVFEQSLARLRQEFVVQGKTRQFEELKSFLTHEPAPGAYAAVAASLDLSPNALAVAVHRLRQRYAVLVRDSVAQTVAQPDQVEEELRYLISLI